MDCGVPVKAAVSGIAMGLLIEGNDYIILSDIAGLEDHYGDMDFKVAGTKDGITALQLDIKVSGLSKEILENALAQAKEGRLYILDKMNTVIDAPRRELNDNAPKMHSIFIDPSKIGAVIGTGGKVIRSIESESGATVTIKEGDTGEIIVSAVNKEQLNKALKMIEGVTKEPEIGEIYEGKVVKTAIFGAFIEICPGKEGLLHISKIAKERVNNVEDHLKVGDLVKVKVVGVDEKKRISLDRLFE
jgi:polyribonucleotide nucleotidyltransferase